MRYVFALCFVLMHALSVHAQSAEQDKDYITTYLEEALSDAGSTVVITGFKGALSSRATLESLTIADDSGVWLTMKDAVLDWNRASVLQGNIQINEISAASLELLRLPGTAEATVRPEARSFAIPELPVSVNIGAISVKKVSLGEPVVGVAAVASVTGALIIAEGEGEAKLTITREDSTAGIFKLEAAFSNATRILALNASLREAADGIVANLISLPGTPPLDLTITGEDMIDNFAANVVLKTDGRPRLTGRILTLANEAAQDGASDEGAPNRTVEADIKGDLTSLFAPQYRDFLGTNVRLESRISLFEDGRKALDDLTLTAAALRLKGDVALAADGLPERFQLDAVLQDPEGSASLLPIPGDETWVQSAKISARFDSQMGDAWSFTSDMEGYERAGVMLEAAQITASGVIARGAERKVTARIDGVAAGLELVDAALAEALGDKVSLGADLAWQDGQSLAVSNLDVHASGLELRGGGTIDGLNSAMTLQGAMEAKATSIKRFSAIAGQSLGGGIVASLEGRYAVLSGEVDLRFAATGADLRVGETQIDRLIGGESRLVASVLRTTSGLSLRSSSIVARGGTARAQGHVATDASQLTFDATLNNAAQFVSGLNGPANMTGTATQTPVGWSVSLDMKAPRAIALTASVELPKNAPLYAEIEATSGSIAWIVPDLAGPGSVKATVRKSGAQWGVKARAEGPSGSTVNIDGLIAANATSAGLTLVGRVPLGLVNRRLAPNTLQGFADFDMKLNGPLALSSLDGTLRTNGARLSLPALRNALGDIDATIAVSGGNAVVRSSASVSSGGEVKAQGRIGLQAPYVTRLDVDVENVGFSDPKLYKTSVNGSLVLGGAIASGLSVSGQLVLGETEVRVPSTGLSSFGDIPKITHLHEPAAVRRMRAHAGLLGNDNAGDAAVSSNVALDVRILAENKIFVRGRGLDAELGGQLTLTGTTTDIIPKGRFELIRGRLDILGKRLDMQEGYASLQGSLTPYLRLVASTSTGEHLVLVTVEGAADEPEITFTSEPELPSDEVLARLLFGRDVTKISAFQTVQLASAVATLAGRGGIGIVEKLRMKAGVDELDITTDEAGETTLRAGKYISETVYTDVEVETTGQSRINLNLDLSTSTKLRGSVDTEGKTGIGLFFEKDY